MCSYSRSQTTHFSASSVASESMDLLTRRFLIQHGSLSQSQALPPITSSGSSSILHPHLHSSSTSFPIIAIAIIGIMATAFLLVSYYIFVIKCCLNWHRIDLLRRFSPSRRREDLTAMYSPGTEPRGLDDAVIRLIPLIHYRTEGSREEKSFSECAVCLNEFQEDERLRIIPNCSHVFHIDCIDVWLQNNANCPLCRTSISFTNRSQIDQLLNQRLSVSQDQTPPIENLITGDENFVVIELGNDHIRRQSLQRREERELPTCPISPLPRKLEHRNVEKKPRKLHKVTSMGDECIDIRGKDEQFSVQPIRRSFSMGSSGDRHFYLAVQEALKQQQKMQVNEVNSIEGCSGSSSGRAKKSFFSFGYGSRSRSSVQPVYLDP